MPKLHRRKAALCALVLLGSALIGPARGQSEHANPHAFDNPGHSEDHGNGGGNGNGGSNSSGNGNGSGGDHGSSGGNSGGNGNGNNGAGASGGSATEASSAPPSSAAPGTSGGAAVYGGNGPSGAGGTSAVSLETILDQVNTVTDGKVIDAKLVTVRGFLLYEIRVLEPNDNVHRLYYYARSGRPVE